jgi:hypothetical protein
MQEAIRVPKTLFTVWKVEFKRSQTKQGTWL